MFFLLQSMLYVTVVDIFYDLLKGRKNQQNQSNQDLIFSLFQFLNASIPKNLLPPGAGLRKG